MITVYEVWEGSTCYRLAGTPLKVCSVRDYGIRPFVKFKGVKRMPQVITAGQRAKMESAHKQVEGSWAKVSTTLYQLRDYGVITDEVIDQAKANFNGWLTAIAQIQQLGADNAVPGRGPKKTEGEVEVAV